MGDILQDLPAPALAGVIKANLFAWYQYLGRSPRAEFHDGPQLTWLVTGISDGFANAVLRAQVEPENVDAAIEETLARFENVAAMSWWTEPGTQPTDLGTHLLAHGLAYAEGGPGMAADLLALNEDMPTPPDLTIEPVEDTEGLRRWAHVSIVGFGLPESEVETWFDVFAGLGFDLPLRNYVGILDGEPVATAELFLAAGVAGIYVVATVPDARRQGIGAALTLAPLLEARALGYRVGILHASPMGLGVYRRLGFRETCRMSHYVWSRRANQ